MSVHAKRRADYQPPGFSIATVDLHITLHPTQTKVKSKLSVTRQGSHTLPLRLDGDNLSLDAVTLNAQPITDNTSVNCEC